MECGHIVFKSYELSKKSENVEKCCSVLLVDYISLA